MNPFYDPPAAVNEWRWNRGLSIGSSDTAAILGISRHKSADVVYLEKVAATDYETPPAVEPEPLDLTNPLHRGHLYEPLIAKAYELRHGVTLSDPPKNWKHIEKPYLTASLDRVDWINEIIVELKKVDWRNAAQWGEDGTDHVPDIYIVQAQHQLAVTGWQECRIAALIGDDDFRVYPIKRNEELIAHILDELATFWSHVQRREPPPVHWSTATPAIMNKLRPPVEGVAVQLDETFADLCEAYQRVAKSASDVESEKQQLKCRIIDAMGEAERATSGLYTVTRKNVERGGYEVKPSTYVDVRIRKARTE